MIILSLMALAILLLTQPGFFGLSGSTAETVPLLNLDTLLSIPIHPKLLLQSDLSQCLQHYETCPNGLLGLICAVLAAVIGTYLLILVNISGAAGSQSHTGAVTLVTAAGVLASGFIALFNSTSFESVGLSLKYSDAGTLVLITASAVLGSLGAALFFAAAAKTMGISKSVLLRVPMETLVALTLTRSFSFVDLTAAILLGVTVSHVVVEQLWYSEEPLNNSPKPVQV